ncbi:MAG: non-ribosomal peptide synthetase [Rubripirellula sp.]
MTRPEGLAELSAEQQRALLERLLQQRAKEDLCFPMSVQQQALWYDYRREPEAAAYNVFMPSRVRASIHLEALRKSIELLATRHACLRTTFDDQGGKLTQQVHDSLPPDFLVVDAEALDESEVRRRVIQECQRPFDLEKGPLLRLTLFRLREDDWILIAVSHHIVVDFWSLVLMLSDVAESYGAVSQGKTLALAVAPANYPQFVRQQQSILEGERGDELRRYWRHQVEDAASVIELPADYVRPERFTRRADVVTIQLSREITDQMAELAKRSGATFQASVLGALQTMIYRYTGQESFHIGSPFSGRLLREYEQTVGFFVNMLPLRADVSGDVTFTQLIQRAGKTLVDALQHEELPLAEIIREAGVPRDASRSPLFQVSCTFEKSHVREEQGRAGYLFPSNTQRKTIGGLEQESYSIPVQTCHYDIEFVFEKGESGLHGMLCYCRDLFARESMEAFGSLFEDLVTQLVTHPNRPLSEVSWKLDAEKNGAPKSENRVSTRAAQSPETETETWMLSQIKQVAERTPQQPAFKVGSETTTYGELDQQANAIAAALSARGIGRGDYVPVVGDRGPNVIPAMLGVMRCGAAMVPIDATQPAVSPADLLQDTDARIVLTEHVDDWIAPADVSAPPEVLTVDALLQSAETSASESLPSGSPAANDLCYVIYTSGSSGRPKGVMVEHAAIDNTFQWRSELAPLGTDDRILILLSHQFDAGFGLIFGALVQGATLVWSDQPSSDVDAIVDLMIRESMTVLPMIPALLTLIIDHPRFDRCRSLRQVWTGGETMPPDLAQRLKRHRRIPLWNFYGPTEAAIESSAANVIDHDPRCPMPIGYPVSNTELLILDQHQRPLPATVPGEMAVCGPGLARGYLGRPGLTMDRFPTRSDGRRVYLTGDRGRCRSDGMFEFFGRTDHQVKLGGYRIELEEIEQVLRGCASIADAAVAVINSASPYLVAYVSFADDASPASLAEVRKDVATRLPSFKRPRHYEVLASLPKTTSGKIDRGLLPEVTYDEGDDESIVAPRTPLEVHLSQAWSEMLGLSTVGIYQDFFELGGTSLQAATMAARLSEDLEIHVPTSLLFDLADIARLAARLATLHPDEIAIRFGSESVAIYPKGEDEDDSEAEHPLIATLKDESDVETLPNPPAPIFMVHPPGGIVVCYRELAQRCADGQAFYAIRSRGLHGEETLPETVQEMAADYIDAIRHVRPHGPYQLGGWSLGGMIAYEITQQLSAAGETVERLILLDTAIPEGASDLVPADQQSNAGLEYGIEMTLEELGALNPSEQLPILWEHAKSLGVLEEDAPAEVVERALQDLKHLFHHHADLVSKYKMLPCPVGILLFRPQEVPFEVKLCEDRGWGSLAPKVDVAVVPGHHHSMVQPPNVDQIAARIGSIEG